MGVTKFMSAIAICGLVVTFAGCDKKVAYPTCKSDSDCRVDATGKEINGICYMGKCEECVADADCGDSKQCVNNRCLASCLSDGDCGAGKHCESSFCVADCSGNDMCPGGQTCAQGRCVAQGDSLDPNAWAASECRGLERIHFDFDKYDVKAEYKENVSRVAQCLESNPGYSVTIEGNTDDIGTPSYNLALGQRRADAVKTALRSEWGIAAHRITTISNGEQKPLVSDTTEYAYQQNRRAEFLLQK